jgi:hypothetical protein
VGEEVKMIERKVGKKALVVTGHKTSSLHAPTSRHHVCWDVGSPSVARVQKTEKRFKKVGKRNAIELL